MRVSEINSFIVNYKNNQYNYSPYNTPVRRFGTVSFGQRYPVIQSYSQFRKFGIKMGAHCLYCNNILSFDNLMINSWKNQKLFQAPIKVLVRELKPYSKSLHNTEGTIFSIISNISKKSPNARLSTVIKILSAQSNKKLLNEQIPVFKQLAEAARELPPEYQKQIYDLLNKNRARLLRIPNIEEFSAKDFKYKIKKLSLSMENNKAYKDIKHLSELLTIPDLKLTESDITPEVLERIRRTIAEADRNPNYVLSKKAKKSRNILKSTIVNKIKEAAASVNRIDIIKLCEDAEKRINGIPVAGKFSNKAFCYDLNAILENFDNKELKKKLFDIAAQLPTSEGSIHAFIIKHADASSDTIGYNLFEPSAITIEHMQPSSLNGPDLLRNWAFACKRCNNKRQSEDMNEFFKMFKQSNAVKYWNQIIDWCNKGYFSFEDTTEMLKIFKRQCSSIKINSNKKLQYLPGINV